MSRPYVLKISVPPMQDDAGLVAAVRAHPGVARYLDADEPYALSDIKLTDETGTRVIVVLSVPDGVKGARK